jgi:hypothetical protein
MSLFEWEALNGNMWGSKPRLHSDFFTFLHPRVMDNKEILAVHSLLHLIYHRNKNQHQRAKWWKWLSALKRISVDLRSIDAARAAACRKHLASQLVPRCYMYVIARDPVCYVHGPHCIDLY